MAPIYVKGGTWTHIEDQILKAAISKYGLTQWARISSLLPKKTAKQAKARWYEYLLPRTQGTLSWAPEEDEKLLNLVKVFPNQWRTIAPIVGKTAAECVQRYQKLVDDDGDADLGLSGSGIETLPATGPNVESKPNISNFAPETQESLPEELDDDHKEMLAEAKARLANTQGKKAKRKARERMLDESKRIALLQKRREMKAAGVNVRLDKLKKGEFDHANDLVNELAPLPGPYDVSQEEINDQRSLELAKKTINQDIHKDKRQKKQTTREPDIFGAEPEPQQKVATVSDLVLSKPTTKKTKAARVPSTYIMSLLREVPPPKNTTKEKPIEEYTHLNRPEKTSVHDYGEHLRNLELLRQVSEERAKLRRSQVVQRGLSIPYPEKTKPDFGNLDVPKKYREEVASRLAKEFADLVKSDYEKYVEGKPFGLVEDLDEDIWEKVHTELEREKKHTEKREKRDKFKETQIDINSRIDMLTNLYANSAQLKEQFDTAVNFDEFSDREYALLEHIKQLHDEGTRLQIELDLEKKLMDVDAEVYGNRRTRLMRLMKSIEHRASSIERSEMRVS